MQPSALRGEGVPLPLVKERPWWRIVAPVGHVPLAVTILSQSFRGYYVHYILEIGKNLPCAQTADCYQCRRGHVPRWCGYAPVYSTNHKATKIVALSEGAANQLLDQLKHPDGLRGLQIILQRQAPHNGARKRNDPVRVQVKGRADPSKLLPAFDILHSLERMWGCNHAFFKTDRPEWDRLGMAPGEVPNDDAPSVN